MSLNRIHLVQGDTLPQLLTQLRDTRTETPLSVAGGTVLLSFRAQGSTTVLFTVYATLLAGTANEFGQIDSTVYPTVGSGGLVKFAFPTGALDIASGYYEGEIRITFADATIQTLDQLVRFSVKENF